MDRKRMVSSASPRNILPMKRPTKTWLYLDDEDTSDSGSESENTISPSSSESSLTGGDSSENDSSDDNSDNSSYSSDEDYSDSDSDSKYSTADKSSRRFSAPPLGRARATKKSPSRKDNKKKRHNSHPPSKKMKRTPKTHIILKKVPLKPEDNSFKKSDKPKRESLYVQNRKVTFNPYHLVVDYGIRQNLNNFRLKLQQAKKVIHPPPQLIPKLPYPRKGILLKK